MEHGLTANPVVLAISFLITLSIIVLIFIVFQMRLNRPTHNPCDSSACRRALAFLDSVSNPDVRPCDDFYSHVCHRWIVNDSSFLADVVYNFYDGSHPTMMMMGSELPDRYGTHIFKSVYRLCHEFVTKGRNSINDILGHVKTETHNFTDNANITLWLARLSLEKGLDSIFRFRVVKWRDNRILLYVTPGKSLMQRLGEDTREGNFRQYLGEVIDSVNFRSSSDNVLDGIVELDSKISNHTEDNDEQPVRHEVADLTKLSYRLTAHDWLMMLNAILARGISGLNVGHEFLASDFNTTVNVVQTVLSSQVRDHYVHVLLAAELLRFDYGRRFNRYTSVPAFCFGASMKLLTHTWAFLVARSRDTSRGNDELSQLYEAVFSAMTETKYNEWLDDTTRDRMLTLLKGLTMIKFSTEELNVDISVDYSKLSAPTDFFGDYLPLLGQGIHVHLQVPPLHDTEALNEIQHNGILRHLSSSGLVVIPTASKTSPLFYSGQQVPSYFNFGTIGSLLAKELSNMVRPFLSRGKPNPMWTKWGISALKPTLQCLKSLMAKVDPNSSDGYEDFFEWSRGVKIACNAMESHAIKTSKGIESDPQYVMEAKRVFFRRFCLSTCGRSMGRVRCNLPLLNMAEFAYAFGCGENDRMVPDRRCASV